MVKSELDNKHALARYLGCKVKELVEERNGAFSYGKEEYLVLTDSEADDAVKDYIKESVWSFNASFLSCQTGLPEEVFIALQDKCESANDTIMELIEHHGEGFNSFVEEAVSSDGRGHFISAYDGEENEEGEYFIYRVN